MHDDSSQALRTWGDFFVECVAAFAAGWFAYGSIADAEELRNFGQYAFLGGLCALCIACAIADLNILTRGGGADGSANNLG